MRLIRRADPTHAIAIPRPEEPGALAIIGADPREQMTFALPFSRGRALLAVAVLARALSGSGLAVGAATGLIDLGNGQSAQPAPPGLLPVDRAHPYVYRLEGVSARGSDGGGSFYLESSEPLATSSPGHVNASAIEAARRACISSVKQERLTDGETATVWVFDRRMSAKPSMSRRASTTKCSRPHRLILRRLANVDCESFSRILRGTDEK